MSIRSGLGLPAAVVALALVLGACSGSASGSAAPASAGASPAGPPAAVGSAVQIKNFAFDPASLPAKVGATVIWTNADTTAHTVTADDGAFDSKNIAPGQTFNQTFSKAGTFAYHCSIHTTMKGTITIS